MTVPMIAGQILHFKGEGRGDVEMTQGRHHERASHPRPSS